jgi:hypothetical protein
MRLAITVLAALLLPIPSVAQQIAGQQHIDTDGKKQLLQAPRQALAGRANVQMMALPRALVVYTTESEHKADLAAAEDQARQSALRIEHLFDICERMLPPHAGCGDRFLVLDDGQLLKDAWKAPTCPDGLWLSTLAETFARSQHWRVADVMHPLAVWAVYERAWFGEKPPANWFSALATARLQCAFLATVGNGGGSGKKGKEPEPFTRQMARDWSKLDDKELAAAVAELAPGMGPPSARGTNAYGQGTVLMAAFLAFAPQEKKSKLPPEWGTIVQVYAERRLAGDDDAKAAVAAGLDKLDREAMVKAMRAWAKARSK